jgi:hypothetical protein
MNKQILKAAALSLLAAGLAMPPPAIADPPPWAPAYGYRAKQHHYVYYPRQEVYYAPETRLWFWLDGGRWRFGASLPPTYYVAGTPGVSVYLGSARPYYEHYTVVERYGGRHHHRHHRH